MRIDFSNISEEELSKKCIDENNFKKLNSSRPWSFERIIDKEKGRRIKDLSNRLRQDFDTLVNVGIGGSALGGKTLVEALSPNFPYFESSSNFTVRFLDNLDNDLLDWILNLDLENTVFYVVSKSGETIETLYNFLVIREILIERGLNWKDHMVVATGGGALKEWTDGCLEIIEFPNVPGRYSALSEIGLLPVSFTGADPVRILDGALKAKEKCNSIDFIDNPAYKLASIYYRLEKPISVIMPYSERLSSFTEWYAQLFAESLGKEGKGKSPIKALGTKDQHSLLQLFIDGPRDKLITAINVDRDNKRQLSESPDKNFYLSGKYLEEVKKAQFNGTKSSLFESDIPIISIDIDLKEEDLGELLYIYEIAVSSTGILYDINPFNQPGVELGKEKAHSILNNYEN